MVGGPAAGICEGPRGNGEAYLNGNEYSINMIGGGGGIIVLILVALYIGAWVVAILGGALMLFLIVRSFVKKRRKRALVQIAIAAIFILPAPSITYYLTTTFENANKAIHERNVEEAAKREEEVRKQSENGPNQTQ